MVLHIRPQSIWGTTKHVNGSNIRHFQLVNRRMNGKVSRHEGIMLLYNSSMTFNRFDDIGVLCNIFREKLRTNG